MALDELLVREIARKVSNAEGIDSGNHHNPIALPKGMVALEYAERDECINQEKPYGLESYGLLGQAVFDHVLTQRAKELGVPMPDTYGIILLGQDRKPRLEDVQADRTTTFLLTEYIECTPWEEVPTEREEELRDEWWSTFRRAFDSGLHIADSVFPEVDCDKTPNNVVYSEAEDQLYFIDPTRWRLENESFMSALRDHTPEIYCRNGEVIGFDSNMELELPECPRLPSRDY